MVRHILFWKLNDACKTGDAKTEALRVLSASVATLLPIPGLKNAEIGENLAGGDYDLVFYAEFNDMDALAAFRDHPLHVAHRERCTPYVTGRLAGDLLR